MRSTGFLLTLGLGMTSLLPQNCEVKKAVDSAAESLEQAAKKAANSVGM